MLVGSLRFEELAEIGHYSHTMLSHKTKTPTAYAGDDDNGHNRSALISRHGQNAVRVPIPVTVVVYNARWAYLV